ncbi:GNAT family N-acetyltransferase [Oceanirhabdus sp. W0125-5]|uniref:GNAT family N-acetyltransferase n=1 Tax=Oceanirhabdus sp. W0125-5 TaxID=2999116 RepID=UPI0022F2D96E|nr:GNAT family N-acetyltransferase [Oceanirhabdus sp. W0125-5]WBW94941.1 GNAT family N-acetyltransferase [Oceanirhabdus sp. W0125-5]
MMILSIDETRLEEAAQYASNVNRMKIDNCETITTFYKKILSNFRKRIKNEDDKVLVCTEQDKIVGVLAILVETNDKYIEITKGLYAAENFQEIAMLFYTYIKEKYAGFHLDAVYSQENKEAIYFMQSIGASCISPDIKMKLVNDDFQPSKENKLIVPITEKYYKSFCRVHDENHKNVYWTGERLLSNLNKFDILIALDKDELVGSVVSSVYGDKKKDILFIETDSNHRRQGYAKSLLEKSINEAFLFGINEITLQVVMRNIPAKKLYESLGFLKTDTIYTYSIESL